MTAGPRTEPVANGDDERERNSRHGPFARPQVDGSATMNGRLEPALRISKVQLKRRALAGRLRVRWSFKEFGEVAVVVSCMYGPSVAVPKEPNRIESELLTQFRRVRYGLMLVEDDGPAFGATVLGERDLKARVLAPGQKLGDAKFSAFKTVCTQR